jgi:Zn-dependent protease with chaperone function
MSAVLVLTGLALLALPGVVASPARHLRPSEWRRLNRVAIRLGFMMVALGLVLAAVPMVLDAAGVESVAEVCHHLLGPAAPGGAITGGVSLTISLALFAVAGAGRRRSRRLQRAARIEGWFGDHTRLPDATLVVLPTDAVVAYATPGSPAQVVVSRGLTSALGSDELDAVVRHELAHLRNRHHRDLVLAGVVDATLGWIPGLRASTAALRLSIERSADEEAAERPGAREATRRALLKTTETILGPVPAFTAAFTLLARLHALATPPPDPSLRQRVAAFAPLAGLAVVAAVGLLECSVPTHHSILHLVGDCPMGVHTDR